MRLYPTILLVSTIICPTVAEVLTQSFVIRLKEMEQLIQDQKQMNEDQKQVIESLKSDWNEALNNNTKIITEQKQTIQDQKKVNEDQKQLIDALKSDWNDTLNNNTKMITEQRKMIESLKTDVYFTFGLLVHGTFPNVEIIKFDRVINNVGGGYIDDVNSVDYGKFIASHNGTYQFNANLFSNGKLIGGDLMKNGEFIIAMKNGADGSTGLSGIVDLTERDEVYLLRGPWANASASYESYFNSFSGFLIQKS